MICALAVELHAVVDLFDGRAAKHFARGIPCFIGKIGEFDVVAVVLPAKDQGLLRASSRSYFLQSTCPNLKYFFLVGIAGAFPTSQNDIRLGDVVIGTSVCRCDAGKRVDGELEFRPGSFERAPATITNILPTIPFGGLLDRGLEVLKNCESIWDHCWTRPESLRDVLYMPDYQCVSPERKCNSCTTNKAVPRDLRSSTTPKVHHGLIASCDSLLKDSKYRETLRRSIAKRMMEDPLAIEMEAAGIEGYIVVRGISDYADSHKNDRWQEYAAATAAACFRGLLQYLPPPPPCPIPGPDATEQVAPEQDTPEQEEVERSADPREEISDETFSTKVLTYSTAVESLPQACSKGLAAYVKLKELRDDGASAISRRLILESASTGGESSVKIALWIPQNSIEVTVKDSILTASFSDGRGKQERWLNGTKSYICVYDPKHHNTTVRLELQDQETAKVLRNYLLFENPGSEVSIHELEIQLPSWESPRESPESRRCKLYLSTLTQLNRTSADISEDSQRILVATETSSPSATVILYLGKYFDFDIEIGPGQQFSIEVQKLQRISYKTNGREEPVWPPCWLDKTPDGGAPMDVILGNTLAVRFQPAEDKKFKEFVLALTGWELRYCGFNITYRVDIKKMNRCKIDVSVWRKDQEFRILCHNKKDQIWTSTILKPPQLPPEIEGKPCPSLVSNVWTKTVTLEESSPSNGSHVLWSNLTSSDLDGERCLPQCFDFESSQYCQSFVKMLPEFVTPSQERRTSASSTPSGMGRHRPSLFSRARRRSSNQTN